MRHLFDRPLGTSVPNGVLLKRYDPSALIVAGAQMAGSFAQNQINAERAASDMATYLHLTKWNRQNQLRDQEWSKKFTYDLQRQQNLYDSPKEQMKRLQDAGLNPYLVMGGASGVSPNVSKNAMSPSLPGSSSVSPFQRQPLDNPFPSSVSNLVAASSLHAQRISADSQFAKSLPDLVRGLGKEGALRVASSVFGRDISIERIDNLINIQVERENIARQREDLALRISQEFDEAKQDVILQNLALEGHRINAEANKLYTEGRLNEASIKELITRSSRNVAEAAKLGADTRTIDALRPYVVKSADMQASMDEFDKIEAETDFIQGREARAWQRSFEGRAAATAAQVVSDNPETNLVNKITHAHTSVRRKYRGK